MATQCDHTRHHDMTVIMKVNSTVPASPDVVSAARPTRSRPVPVGVLLAATLMLAVPAGSSAAVPGKYVGPDRCSASFCHGSPTERKDTRVLQNEQTTWLTKDRHSRAWDVLNREPSLRIAKGLGLPSAATAARCLACHALPVPPARQDRPLAIESGVSCETCHGPASGWLSSHAMVPRNQPPAESHAKNLKLGMLDMNDPVVRAEKCLSCHLGDSRNFVDHELIALGHPDLVFEMITYSTNMPPHWRPHDPARQLKDWALGEAVQLREHLRRVADRARDKTWPEYAELNCFGCHHPLTPPAQSWRQKAYATVGKPGDVTFDRARYDVYDHFLRVIDPGAERSLAHEIDALSREMATLSASRNPSAQLAERSAGIAGEMVRRVQAATFDRRLATQLLLNISGDGAHIAFLGHRTILQAVWVMDVLLQYLKQSGVAIGSKQPEAIVERMWQHLGNASNYSAPVCAEYMLELNRNLGALK